MPRHKERPYGTWQSPITSEIAASGTIRFDSQIALSDDGIFWIEIRPEEAGRYVVVRWQNGVASDVTPSPFNARTRVHEYGGGSFLLDGEDIYFSNFADQRMYRHKPGNPPLPITPQTSLRFADGVMDHSHDRIICVCEDHREQQPKPINTIVAVNRKGNGIQQLVRGNDFYSTPRISPDGSRLAWLTWNLPDMPWDSAELWMASVTSDGFLKDAVKIAGDRRDSICQPRFAPDGTLYFVSERTGWWNLYRWNKGAAEPLYEIEAEFGSPSWTFGLSDYAFQSSGRIICRYVKSGNSYVGILETATGTMKPLGLPYTSISAIQATAGYAILLAGSPTQASSIVKLDLATAKTEVLRQSSQTNLDAAYFSIPEAIDFPTENGLTSHALYYGPKNRDFVAPQQERAPLLVVSHGGPTSAASSVFNLSVQYWTSRGFAAVADVNTAVAPGTAGLTVSASTDNGVSLTLMIV